MFQKIFQPHLKNFIAKGLSIHHKIHQDEFLKIHIVFKKDHSNLYKIFQRHRYLNKIFLNADLLPTKEYYL